MLVKVSYDIINTVQIGFVYDDNTVKKVEVANGDIVELSYLHNGKKKEVSGEVKRIFTEAGHAGHIGHIASCNNCKNETCYIYVDASTTNNSDLVKIDVDCIFDLNIVQKADKSDCVKTPSDCTKVTTMRMVKDELQISTDYGVTWYAVGKVEVSKVIVDPSDQAMADKIAATLPDCMNTADKNTLVENLLNLYKENKCNCGSCEELSTEVEDDPQTP